MIIERCFECNKEIVDPQEGNYYDYGDWELCFCSDKCTDSFCSRRGLIRLDDEGELVSYFEVARRVDASRRAWRALCDKEDN